MPHLLRRNGWIESLSLSSQEYSPTTSILTFQKQLKTYFQDEAIWSIKAIDWPSIWYQIVDKIYTMFKGKRKGVGALLEQPSNWSPPLSPTLPSYECHH